MTKLNQKNCRWCLDSLLPISFTPVTWCLYLIWAGRRGLVDSTLGSRDRVRGFKSWSRQSGFFWALFFSFLLSSYLSLSDCKGIFLDHKVICFGRDKESPSSVICGANAEISAMYGGKKLHEVPWTLTTGRSEPNMCNTDKWMQTWFLGEALIKRELYV